MQRRFRLVAGFAAAALIVIGAVATAGCSSAAGSPADAAGREPAMAPLSEMPAEVRAAPVVVQQAYQFALANPDIVQQLPCYCGCGAMGHASNYACYVASVDADGRRVFDSHALGCSICVDITQDAIRLTRQGKSPPAIRAYIDQTYSRYGPSNMP